MARMTIAQKREREVKNLASFKNPEPTPADIDEARTLMNSFYRLSALCDKNLMLGDDERTANRFSTKRSEEREMKWYKRLDKKFQELYGLNLVYISWYPLIGIKTENGGFYEKISTYYYNK